MTELLSFLQTICEKPHWESEWIDLLSQLEYVGCRKILKGVPFERMDLNLLQHVSEEASHAYLLKKAAGPEIAERSWREGKFADLGWNYFRCLDEQTSRLPEEKQDCYPIVSWAIERRVMEVYPAYLKITRNEELRRALAAILEQEKRHGAQFEGWNLPTEVKDRAILIERGLWREFVEGLKARVDPAPLS